MKKIFSSIIVISCSMNCLAQNVGINTTAPQAYGHGGTNRVLELKNDAGTGADIQSHLILSTNGTSGSLGSLTWAAPNIPGAEKRTALIANVFETANATRLAFYTRIEAGSITEKFSINGNGNVGIGNNNPNAPLAFANALGRKITFYHGSQGNVGLGVYNNELRIHTDYDLADITFGYENNADIFTERMRIKGNGNIGIGNNNPNAPLAFPALLGKKITLYPGGTGDVGLAVQGNLLQIYADHPNADIAFGYDQGGVFTERMRVKGNGNVGVGTNNPAEKLEIAGNIKANAFKFSTSKTYYYSIPPSAFRSASSADVTVGSWASISFNSVPTPTGGLMAPVYLPDGAIVTSLTAYYYDNSPTTDIRIELNDHFHGTGGGGLMASVISSGATGEGNGIDNTISFNPVNNQVLDYTIEVSSTVGPWPVFIGLRSVVITYTLTEVY